MIYVDTLSGKLIIDTEIDPVKNTIVITRSSTGTQIQYTKAKGKIASRESRWLSGMIRIRSFVGIQFQW